MNPFKMTNEIAFDLGAFKYNNFYDHAVWRRRENFEYEYFFDWVPYHATDENSYWGDLREDKFETLEHKYYYIQGLLSLGLGDDKYYAPVTIKDDEISYGYANSIDSRDRFVKWAREVIRGRFGRSEDWRITIYDGGKTIPSTPGFILKAEPYIINYFKEGNYYGRINASRNI